MIGAAAGSVVGSVVGAVTADADATAAMDSCMVSHGCRRSGRIAPSVASTVRLHRCHSFGDSAASRADEGPTDTDLGGGACLTRCWW
jgi:hypothetical protein